MTLLETKDRTVPPLANRRSEAGDETAELKRMEPVLTTCLILLKLHVLHQSWGRIQGFDAAFWIDVFRVTDWFRPLPSVKAFPGSYHPPLSYLIGRWIYAIYPHEIEASQLLSTLSIIGSVLALRSILRTTGLLWTPCGMTMLYVSASMPLLVWLSIETSYDALVLMWITVILAISMKLFWAPSPGDWWRKRGRAAGTLVLGLALAAGMLTKFNCSIAFGLPFLVVLTRRGLRAALREASSPLVATAIALILIAPLYYTRYYAPLGKMFPQAMEWLRADDLARALRQRDADRWGFIVHILRIPTEPITGTQEPVRDSFIHSIWLQMWKRDGGLGMGQESPLALAVSDLYIRTVPYVAVPSTILFFFLRRKIPKPWWDLGCVLLTVFVTFCAALLYFGWSYPLWDWEIFKAKYISPSILWIAYCLALPISFWPARLSSWRRVRTNAVLFCVLLFMFINHLLPVYA